MVDDIQKEVEYQIKESDWLDEETKDHVFGKLVNMKKYIGYPNWYRNNTIVKRYFQGVSFLRIITINCYTAYMPKRHLKKRFYRSLDILKMF